MLAHARRAPRAAIELKKLDVPNDYAPMKVKLGHGDAVCAILLSLLERLNQEFQKPYHRPDDYTEEAQVDEDAALDADAIADEVGADTEDEDDLYYGAAGIHVAEDAGNTCAPARALPAARHHRTRASLTTRCRAPRAARRVPRGCRCRAGRRRPLSSQASSPRSGGSSLSACCRSSR